MDLYLTGIAVELGVRSVSSKNYIGGSEFTFSSLKEIKLDQNMRQSLSTERTLESSNSLQRTVYAFSPYAAADSSDSPIGHPFEDSGSRFCDDPSN